MPALARDFAVVVVDQRGMGLPGKPMDGYDTATLANDLAALTAFLAPYRDGAAAAPSPQAACRSGVRQMGVEEAAERDAADHGREGRRSSQPPWAPHSAV